MKNEEDPTKNFEWDYILVDNDKVVNAWCMPGGKNSCLHWFIKNYKKYRRVVNSYGP